MNEKRAEEQIRRELFALQDGEYRDFHAKLIPTVNPDNIIGVRTPELRKYARKLSKTPLAEEFLTILPHKYYDENNLHGFLIEAVKDYDRVIQLLDKFLPYVDNWATCDLISPKILSRDTGKLLEKIREWMASGHTYTVRFGMEMLMRYYLETDTFQPEYLDMVAGIDSEEYYVKMMAAWFFATALAKQYDAALIYLQEHRLELWTHNKAIQKAVESNRITPEQKAYLRTLRRKDS